MLFHVVFFQKLTERSNVSHAAGVVDDGGDDVGEVVVYEGVWRKFVWRYVGTTFNWGIMEVIRDYINGGYASQIKS